MSSKFAVRMLKSLVLPLALLVGVNVIAASLPPLKDKAILTVSGKIENTNKDKKAQFDVKGFESLGMTSFTTSTPWYKEATKWEGVPLAKVLEAVGSKGGKVVVTALNDYGAEIPEEDIKKFNVMLAIKKNGEYMPVSDKGPLMVIYDFDKYPELKQKKYYSRCVWQLAKIEIK